MVLVKKNNGSFRFYIDYGKLNVVTKQNANPLQHSLMLLSTLDLRSGYWQVNVCLEDHKKTVFMTPKGLYEFLRMSYGLSAA